MDMTEEFSDLIVAYGEVDHADEEFEAISIDSTPDRDIIEIFARARYGSIYEEAHVGLTVEDAIRLADALNAWAYKRIEEGFNCVDCSVNTGAIDEYYMVTDEVWAEAKMEPTGGMLCIGCLETRLGYQLNRSHFTDCPLNVKEMTPKSDRLKSRFEAQEIAA